MLFGSGFHRITDKNAIRGTLDAYMMQKKDKKFVSSVHIKSKNGIYMCVNVTSALVRYDKYGNDHKRYSFAFCDDKYQRTCVSIWLDDIGYIETMYPELDRKTYSKTPGMIEPPETILDLLESLSDAIMFTV